MYRFVTEQFLPISGSRAWEFFSSAKNLALITPPEMNFVIKTDLDGVEIYEGLLIDYTVSPLFGITLNWQTLISEIKKPTMFTDRQLKGPYKIWEHRHYFTEQEKGILMKDEINYSLPFGLLGKLAHAVVVRSKINHIFNYRREMLHQIFVNNGQHNN